MPNLCSRIHSQRSKGARDDVFAALTTTDDQDGWVFHGTLTPLSPTLTLVISGSSTSLTRLSSDDLARLLAALRRNSLRGLSRLDHEHLAVLAQTVHEVGLLGFAAIET